MEAKKSGRYESKHEDGDLEVLNERLTRDLRKQIRELNIQPVLTDQWFYMAEVVDRLRGISDAEAKLPKEKKNGTLWETEELALRYILEDGKLNVCLRMLSDFSNFEQQRVRSRSGSPLSPEQEHKMDMFEKGLGQVLRNTWKYEEAVQTTDVPLLLTHIATVIDMATQWPNEKLERAMKLEDLQDRQEIQVINYLHDMLELSGGGKLDEYRFMPTVRNLELFGKLARFLKVNADKGVLRDMDLLVGFETLSLLADTEDFGTYEDDFLRDCEDDLKDLEPKVKEFKYDDRTRSKVASIYRLIEDLQSGYK